MLSVTRSYVFPTTSPASLKCVFLAFRMRQLTTMYSGRIASRHFHSN